MFSGSITVLIVLVAFFSPEAAGQSSSSSSPWPASTVVANTTTPIAPSTTQATMAPSTASPMNQTCAKIIFIAKQAWNASYGNSSSEQYMKLMETVSKALRSVFNNSEKYYDVKVSDAKFYNICNKESQVQVKAILCLIVKADDVYIEDVFTAKVKSGKLDETFLVKIDSAEFEAIDVGFEDWKAKEGECTKCNEGGGGEIVIEGTCTPKKNCKGLKNTKMSKDCVEYCSAVAATITVSFFILALGILLSFSFQ